MYFFCIIPYHLFAVHLIGITTYGIIIYLTTCLEGIRIENDKYRKFSMRDLFGSLPGVQPLVEAGSSRCEMLKNVLGISYEQIQGKNVDIHESLGIDLVTRNGNVKFNMTSMKNINRQLSDNETLYILIHGYLGSIDGIMVKGISKELLKRSNLKIFALDVGNVFSFEYIRTSTYARFIGEKLGDLLVNIIQNGQSSENIHMIGHSLGAHIAGIAGQQVIKQTGQIIGRITGLDPAAPCFSNLDLDYRLDKTDGKYVDVVHSNAGILGMKETVGHIDFYPNGGTSQAGCYLWTCDHSRSWEYYAESISATDHFPARRCENWTSFEAGQCAENPLVFMKLDGSSENEGSYFFKTGPTFPYGLGAAGSF